MEGHRSKDTRDRLIPQELISTGVWHLDVGSSHPGAEKAQVGCSPIKVARELGSERRETVLSTVGVIGRAI